MGIGLNYADHAAESGLPIPDHPILFIKATSAISGADGDILLPRGSSPTDWEVELGVAIGTRAKYVSVENALSYVAGYCVVNVVDDVTERDFQFNSIAHRTRGNPATVSGL